jgi:hypothetical protein
MLTSIDPEIEIRKRVSNKIKYIRQKLDYTKRSTKINGKVCQGKAIMKQMGTE